MSFALAKPATHKGSIMFIASTKFKTTIKKTAPLLISLALTACATGPYDHQNSTFSDPVIIDENHPPKLVELNFKSHEKRVNGILYQANGAGPHPTVILLHGYPGNEKNLDLAQTLRREGYNVLFFHYRGAWGSEGEFSFTHVIEDVSSASDFLRTHQDSYRVDGDRIILIGHSMGGFAALHGAARDKNVKCVAGIAPADFGLLAKMVAHNEALAKGFSAGADNLTMLNEWSGEKALSELADNIDSFDVIKLAPKLSGKSILLTAGDKDNVLAPDIFHAPMVEAYESQDEITLTHKIISGDHSFSWSRFELSDLITNWIKNCEN